MYDVELPRRPELSFPFGVPYLSSAHMHVVQNGTTIGRVPAREYPDGSGVYFAMMPEAAAGDVTVLWTSSDTGLVGATSVSIRDLSIT